VTVYVFLGPSLPVGKAKEILDATYLPPIQQGDLLRLLDHGPELVGIVDGYFETVPSIWHKEILHAMNAGVHVFGAASMGALRAAELDAFGMIGVGTIFQWYRDGVITADDEVAVTHGPAELGYQPLSVSLVDIRDCCAAAVRDGVLVPGLAAKLIETAAALPFSMRSYELVAERCGVQGVDCTIVDGWLEYAEARGPGLKAQDAIVLLCTMRDFASTSPRPKQIHFELERTIFLEQLINEVGLMRAAGLTALPESEDTPLCVGETIATLRKRMLLRLLAREVGERLGWRLIVEEVEAYAARFRAKFGMLAPDAMRAWMAIVGLTEDEFWRFVNDALLIERLERLHSVEIDRGLADQLRLLTARGWPEQPT